MTSSGGNDGGSSGGSVGIIVGAVAGVLVVAMTITIGVMKREKDVKGEKKFEEEVDLDGLEDFSVHGRAAVQDGFESEI